MSGKLLLSISAAAYHADPCPTPSLSASIARIICQSTPLHAWFSHPRLNPEYTPEEAERFDIGTAAHALLLEGEAGVQVIEADDWRTKAAREARIAARAADKVPLLDTQWAEVQLMVKAAREQLRLHKDGPEMFTDGCPEQVLTWTEADGIWCRARLDWLHSDPPHVDDYKTCGASANPDRWIRTMFSLGMDVQAAFYLRGVKAVGLGDGATFRFAVQETYAPYALSVIALDPACMVLAQKKVLYAIEVFARCLQSGQWPGYPTRTCYADLPSWEEAAWIAKEERG